MNTQLTFIDPSKNALPFKDWQIREGEVLYNDGASSLSNTDLLAHIIRDQSKAEKLMEIHGSLKAITQLSVDELMATKGIGRSTAETILAATEFGRRSLSVERPDVNINSPQSVFDFIAPSLQDSGQEHLKIICLNTKNRIIKVATVFIGTLNNSVVSPREIFRTALKHNAAAIILVHNHPSGDSTPSNDDRNVTKAIIDAGKMIEITVCDHLIIGHDEFYSFKEHNDVF